MSSDNLIGADNQQETKASPIGVLVSRILRDYTPDTLASVGEDIVRAAWRHAEDGRNDHPAVWQQEG